MTDSMRARAPRATHCAASLQRRDVRGATRRPRLRPLYRSRRPLAAAWLHRILGSIAAWAPSQLGLHRSLGSIAASPAWVNGATDGTASQAASRARLGTVPTASARSRHELGTSSARHGADLGTSSARARLGTVPTASAAGLARHLRTQQPCDCSGSLPDEDLSSPATAAGRSARRHSVCRANRPRP